MLQKVRILKRFTLAIVTLLSIAFSAATAQTSAGTSIVGTWQGALDVGGTKLRIVFHVAKTDGGNFVSTLDSPDQAATRIPVSSTTVREDSVILTVASIGGLYIGRISGDKSSIEGRWNQGGASFSLALNRASTAAVTVQTSATNATAQTSVDTSIVGMWQGTLDAGGVKLRAVFHVAKTDSDKFVSTFDSPDQGANGIPVSSTTVNGDSVIFTLASIGGSYVGKISDDKSSIEGKWSQNGASSDLSLNRTSTAVKFNRPQEPNPPFPYKSEEVSFENETTGMHYAGTLTLPDSGGRFPAVILITGSGTHNRNEEVFGHKPRRYSRTKGSYCGRKGRGRRSGKLERREPRLLQSPGARPNRAVAPAECSGIPGRGPRRPAPQMRPFRVVRAGGESGDRDGRNDCGSAGLPGPAAGSQSRCQARDGGVAREMEWGCIASTRWGRPGYCIQAIAAARWNDSPG